jgi:hypothetical protein
MSEKKLNRQELLERIDELLNVLKMVSRDLTDISETLKAAAGAEGAPARREEIQTIKDVRSLFPKDLGEMLAFEESGEYIVVTPRQYLGSENFAKIASIVREAGGEYISAGKESHFRLPRAV